MISTGNHGEAARSATLPAVIKAGDRAAAVREVGDARQFLTFLLQGEMFGAGILGVREIIEFGTLTAVPMAPAYVRGVINLRGAVVPVVDLALRFGKSATEPSRRTCIVIVDVHRPTGNGNETLCMGALVDSVCEVLDISRDEIEPAPEFGVAIRLDFIEGMGKVAGRFVTLLDFNRVLAPEDLVQGVLPRSEA